MLLLTPLPSQYSTLMIVIGAIGLINGLLMYIMSCKKTFPAEKKRYFGVLGVLIIMMGAFLIMWPFCVNFLATP